jgi:hypothetical protein
MTEKLKTLSEFYADLAEPPGSRGFRTAKVERRHDPVVPLKGPLSSYHDRTFFYAGLLYGFCRLDLSITERYREATGSSVRTENHLVGCPLVEVAGFPDFAKTKTAHLLSSIENGEHQSVFFDFLRSQLVVDRKRGVCWRIEQQEVTILDPFFIDNQAPPTAFTINVFCPYTPSTAYRTTQPAGPTVRPVVRAFNVINPSFLREAEEALRGT